MILFSFFTIIAFFLYKNDLRNFFAISFFAILVLFFFLIEYSLGIVDFLISDGFRYYNDPEEWIADRSRATWGYLNYFVKYFDLCYKKKTSQI